MGWRKPPRVWLGGPDPGRDGYGNVFKSFRHLVSAAAALAERLKAWVRLALDAFDAWLKPFAWQASLVMALWCPACPRGS